MSKKFYLSRTFWVNIVALVGVAAHFVIGEDVIPASNEQALALWAALNLFLRFRTREALG